jgi:drug/metabolite transporter (DMT)-like permease
LRCAFAVPPLAVLAWHERRRLGPRRADRAWVTPVAGVIFGINILLYHYAIDAVGAGLSTVLGNLQVVIVAFVAWAVLSERPENRVLVAVPVVLAGVVLISGVLEGGAYGDDPALGVAFGFGCSFAYAAFILLLRSANAGPRRPAGPLLQATAVATLTIGAWGVVQGDLDVSPGWAAAGWLLLLALSSQVVAWLLISTALPQLPAALGALLLLVQPVGAVTLGVIILDEHPSPVQVGGIVVVLAGVLVATGATTLAPWSRSRST